MPQAHSAGIVVHIRGKVARSMLPLICDVLTKVASLLGTLLAGEDNLELRRLISPQEIAVEKDSNFNSPWKSRGVIDPTFCHGRAPTDKEM